MDLKYGTNWSHFGIQALTLASHHGLTLLCGDKLYLAPLNKDKIQVC